MNVPKICSPIDTDAPPRDQAIQWRDDQGAHIDVRGLPAPGPLVAILALVRSVRDGAAVIVHHDRDPLMLYPELAEIGWDAQRIAADPGEVRLRLVPRQSPMGPV